MCKLRINPGGPWIFQNSVKPPFFFGFSVQAPTNTPGSIVPIPLVGAAQQFSFLYRIDRYYDRHGRTKRKPVFSSCRARAVKNRRSNRPGRTTLGQVRCGNIFLKSVHIYLFIFTLVPKTTAAPRPHERWHKTDTTRRLDHDRGNRETVRFVVSRACKKPRQEDAP